jgi:hypothetical protein
MRIGVRIALIRTWRIRRTYMTHRYTGGCSGLVPLNKRQPQEKTKDGDISRGPQLKRRKRHLLRQENETNDTNGWRHKNKVKRYTYMYITHKRKTKVKTKTKKTITKENKATNKKLFNAVQYTTKQTKTKQSKNKSIPKRK